MKKKTLYTLAGLSSLLVCSLNTITNDGNDLTRAVGDEIIKHPVIHLLDGIPFAFDGETIYDMIILNAKIFRLQHGAKNKETGILEGLYTFNGQKHTLHSLAELELSYDHELATKKEELETAYVKASSFAQEWTNKEKEIVKKFDDDLENEIHPKDRHVSSETARRLTRLNRRALQEELDKEKNNYNYRYHENYGL